MVTHRGGRDLYLFSIAFCIAYTCNIIHSILIVNLNLCADEKVSSKNNVDYHFWFQSPNPCMTHSDEARDLRV